MQGYAAYDKGYLPVSGGTDDQPALFMPTMITISSAINEERELEDAANRRNKNNANRPKAPQKPGYAPVKTPGRR